MTQSNSAPSPAAPPAKAFADDDRDAEINADYSRAVAVDTAAMAWARSPAAGVWRKRLELVGEENPRLTTIVRFEPGSRFDEHGHPGGEEILVLSGTFSDASGDFAAGTYLRNPPGWRHAPWTDEGCELFVKLCQFQADDTARVVEDARTAPSGGKPAPLRRCELHRHGHEVAALWEVAAGARGVTVAGAQGLEAYLLAGSLELDGNRYPTGTWLRLPPRPELTLASPDGCRLFCKTVAF